MVTGLWGKKVGMTQLFAEGKVVPVTVIEASNWVVTQIKKVDRNGYDAVQVGHIRDAYSDKTFSADWLKKPREYFSVLREVRLKSAAEEVAVGMPVDCNSVLVAGDKVDISGVTKGCGFTGVVKRHRFAGPPKTHGSTMGKKTGSLSFMRAQGRVIKGKRMPGHFGAVKRTARRLEVVRIEPANIVVVKGSIPGKSGSLVFVRKA